MLAFLKKNSTLIAILAVGLILRLIALLQYGDFWFDEMFSFIYSQKPWLTSLHFWIWETNPPLHMVLLKLWWYFVTPSEEAARLVSVVVGLGSVVALYQLGERWVNRSAGLLAALLLAVNPMHIFYSATARTYALTTLLTIISLHYFATFILEEKINRRQTTYFIIPTTLLLYSHLTAWSLLLAQGVALVVIKKPVRHWLTATATATLLWLPWFIPSAISKLSVNKMSQSWFFGSGLDLSAKLKTLQLLLLGPLPGDYWGLLFIIVLIGLGVILWRQRRNNFTPAVWALFILTALPILLAFGANVTQLKFIWIALAPAILLLAWLATSLSKKWSTIIALLLLPGLSQLWLLLPINNWSSVKLFLEKNYAADKKQIFIYTNFTNSGEVERYLPTPLPKLTYLPHPVTDWDKFYITENYIYMQSSTSTIAKWVVQQKLSEYDDIFLLQNQPSAIAVDLRSALTPQFSIMAAESTQLFSRATLYHLHNTYGRPTNPTK